MTLLILIFVMVDEPVGQKFSYGYATAGWVAAPAIRQIVEQIAPKLGVLPVDETAPENSPESCAKYSWQGG